MSSSLLLLLLAAAAAAGAGAGAGAGTSEPLLHLAFQHRRPPSFSSLSFSSPSSSIHRPLPLSSPISCATTTHERRQHRRSCRSLRRRLGRRSHGNGTNMSASSTDGNDQGKTRASSWTIPSIPYLTSSVPSDRSSDLLLGEDAGVFDIRNESWGKAGDVGWTTFFLAVGTILTAVALLWIYPPTGYGDDFVAFLEDASNGNSHLVTLAFGIIFPLVHSGLASLRPLGERIVGARAWRVIFAFPSLCLAYSWIAYFISHAHDGIQLYDISQNETAHAVAWITNFVSFFFLYPSVFNLKEVAAVERPKIHLWETGIIRITRHPQFVGQTMWSTAHLAMVGTSFTALTMALLVGHHAFACWNGDRRLYGEHGEAFLRVKERTSVFPFQAIWEGRQVLPKDYYKELIRAPYLLIALGTLGAYYAHPYMQAGAALARNTGLVEGGMLDGLFS